MKKYVLLLLFSLFGFFDALYLSYEHYTNQLPPCALGAVFDCGHVLRSEYAVILGIPLAVIGVIYYLIFP